MKVKNKNHLALAYLTQSIHYLLLAESVFFETKQQGNKHIVISDTFITNYEEKTKWSDFNVIFPSLFVFYHGLELLMKGLLTLLENDPETNHRISILFSSLQNNSEIEPELRDKLQKYISTEEIDKTPLGEWLQKNKLSIDNLYERLRYPTDKSQSNITNNQPLEYKGDKMLPFLGEIIIDSKILRKLMVSLYRKIESDNK